MMYSKKVKGRYAIWMIALVGLLFSVKTQAQYYIDGPTTVNFGEVKSYSLKDSSHPNGDLWGEFQEVWWSGDVMYLNNDYGTETTVSAIWDMFIEKDIWMCVSFYESVMEEYYYVETFVSVLPPMPTAPSVLSSDCNQVVNANKTKAKSLVYNVWENRFAVRWKLPSILLMIGNVQPRSKKKL